MASAFAVGSKPPNIVFILSDDLGFNDVGFHGSPQIPTPHIDELARTGVILNNYHVQPVCSPTRATIMSGRHSIHHGIYMPFTQGTSFRLNLSYTLIPQYMRMLGYSTHMVGKWHLGQNVLGALPTGRGFDSYFGYWSGAEDYFNHSTRGAYDLAEGTRTAFEYNGTYSTFLWTEKAVKVIEEADPDKPFFMYLAYQNVHWPLEAPKEYLDRFSSSTGGDQRRQAVCAMAAIMDESIGNITAALKERRLYEETLLVFSADNGGPTNGNEGSWSSNYPMRGGKNTLWEGGTRAVAAVRGPGIDSGMVGKTTYSKVHATDWLPTLLRVASGRPDWLHKHIPDGEPPFLLGDGIDVWETISSGKDVRTELIYECHRGSESLLHGNALVVGDWKILQVGEKNPTMEQGWVPPPGEDPDAVAYQLPCNRTQQPGRVLTGECFKAFCLFNISADPCEYHDLAKDFPDVVARLRTRLGAYQSTAVKIVDEAECGCKPVITSGAWRPCDSPSLSGADVLRWV